MAALHAFTLTTQPHLHAWGTPRLHHIEHLCPRVEVALTQQGDEALADVDIRVWPTADAMGGRGEMVLGHEMEAVGQHFGINPGVCNAGSQCTGSHGLV